MFLRRKALWVLCAAFIFAVAGTASARIVEDIPGQWQENYQRWKAELFSTEFGRSRWQAFETDDSFTLTVAVSDKYVRGAGTDAFEWDPNGKLIAATITLGYELELGFPEPVYYPVLHSISAISSYRKVIRRGALAGAKFAHELSHVENAKLENAEEFLLQKQLMPVYVSIFLSNGQNAADKKLRELADQMGGTPVELWSAREYASELDTLDYLAERLANDRQRCLVFRRLKRNLNDYSREQSPIFEARPAFSKLRC
ncbi:MAG: hypothetical protein IPM50_07420 [Acidobacteriota bacterium]|nr:MAG: hypothetical protein IPM50_07420 [Acidobacteriota bacterium]